VSPRGRGTSARAGDLGGMSGAPRRLRICPAKRGRSWKARTPSQGIGHRLKGRWPQVYRRMSGTLGPQLSTGCGFEKASRQRRDILIVIPRRAADGARRPAATARAPAAARGPIVELAKPLSNKRIWRRERDSNPRGLGGPCGFQDRSDQPLRHPSAGRQHHLMTPTRAPTHRVAARAVPDGRP
jgi:hypothetical protein